MVSCQKIDFFYFLFLARGVPYDVCWLRKRQRDLTSVTQGDELSPIETVDVYSGRTYMYQCHNTSQENPFHFLGGGGENIF